MIVVIAKKEILEILRDGRTRWLIGFIFLMMIISLIIGSKYYSDYNKQYQETERIQRDYWLNMPKMNPHSASHIGMFVFKPQHTLSLADQGINEYTGTSLLLESHRLNNSQFRPAEDSLPSQRFGYLTVGFILQTLIPLLIVLLTFASFAGEREQATLNQVLSSGISPTQLFIGKITGISGVLLILLIPFAIAAITAVGVISDPNSIASNLLRTLLMILAYIIYFAIFVFLGMAVSLLSKTTRVSLMILLVVWFSWCLLLPKLCSDITEMIFPVPQSLDFAWEVNSDLSKLREFWERHPKVVERLKQEYKVGSIADIPVSAEGITLQEGETEETAVYQKHFSNLFRIYEKQDYIYQMSSVLSPSIAIQNLSIGVSGTDFLQYRTFLDSAEEYRQNYVEKLNEDLIQNDKPWNKKRANIKTESYTKGREMWEQIPKFEYSQPSFLGVIDQYKFSIIFLLIWVLALLFLIRKFCLNIKT